MIVRVMADNQYRVGDEHATELDHLDDQLVAAVDASDDAAFETAIHQLIDYIHQNGQALAADEILPSDMMIPAADMSLAEAKAALQKASVQEGGAQP